MGGVGLGLKRGTTGSEAIRRILNVGFRRKEEAESPNKGELAFLREGMLLERCG